MADEIPKKSRDDERAEEYAEVLHQAAMSRVVNASGEEMVLSQGRQSQILGLTHHNFGPELAGALAKAQGEIKHAMKGAENKFIGSQYADLGMVVDAAREPLAKNGLSVSQVTRTDSRAGVILQTYLIHESGQWIRSEIPIRPTLRRKGEKAWAFDENDTQAWGSSITYHRRYQFAAIVGVATEDLDAEAGGRPGTPPDRAPAPQPSARQAQADRDFVEGKDQGKQEETGEAAPESEIHEIRRALVDGGYNTKPKMLKFVNGALGEHGPVDGIRSLTVVQAKLIKAALG
jgi:hypothetical protein